MYRGAGGLGPTHLPSRREGVGFAVCAVPLRGGCDPRCAKL